MTKESEKREYKKGMHRALVTGGGGFVGLAVVRKLRERGIETSVVGRHRYPAAEELGARCLVGDIRDPEFMIRAVAGHDTVFHVAAKAGIWGSFADYYSVNVTGTENVLAACRSQGVRSLIHTSTPSVVFAGRDIEGGDETLPYSEKPLCHYAATKIIAERMVLAANSETLRTAALRPHLVWGPGDTQIIPRLLERGRQGRLRMVGSGLNRVDISFIDNVADAHLLAAQNLAGPATAAGEAFFISQGEPVVLWEWINALFARAGVQPVSRRVPLARARRAGRLLEVLFALLHLPGEPPMTRFLAEQLALSHWFSIAKAGNLLAYAPRVSSAEGMDRLVAWLKAVNLPDREK
ncbi:MAG: NAD-dependent epimerase/dehydratase family protein [Desulfobulbaceae bacterium]